MFEVLNEALSKGVGVSIRRADEHASVSWPDMVRVRLDLNGMNFEMMAEKTTTGIASAIRQGVDRLTNGVGMFSDTSRGLR